MVMTGPSRDADHKRLDYTSDNPSSSVDPMKVTLRLGWL